MNPPKKAVKTRKNAKHLHKAKKFTALPKNLFDLGEGYKAMVRELAKR